MADEISPMPHPITERLEQLAKLKEEARIPGAEASVRRQHERGKLTARERLELLLDPGSFVELDMLARHRAHGFGIEESRALTDGVVTGWDRSAAARSSSSLRTSPSSAELSARSTPRRSRRSWTSPSPWVRRWSGSTTAGARASRRASCPWWATAAFSSATSGHPV